MNQKFMLSVTALLGLAVINVRGQNNFGSGANTFTIDFVNVGNTGNLNYIIICNLAVYDYQTGATETYKKNLTDSIKVSWVRNVTQKSCHCKQYLESKDRYRNSTLVNLSNMISAHQQEYNLYDDEKHINFPWFGFSQNTSESNSRDINKFEEESFFGLKKEWDHQAYKDKKSENDLIFKIILKRNENNSFYGFSLIKEF